MVYQKPLPSYTSVTCQPFQNKIFLNEAEPKFDIHKNMCRTNNACKDDATYSYLCERGVKESPFFVPAKGQVMEKVYKSTKADGRLVDPSRDYTQELDIKPIQVYYDLINDNISQNPELNGYGKNYRNYSTVTGGQIQYYIDKELADPFPRPVYAATTNSIGYTYKDPMDAIKHQFEKAYPKESFSGLSWLDDSCSFRDDITALQQRKHNEQRYELVHDRL
jgi:hypothetical protein